jgi:type I restriction enzyme M protein
MSNAPTCGINKDGAELYQVDQATGDRLALLDDRLETDVDAILAGTVGTGTSFTVKASDVSTSRIATPTFFDLSTVENLRSFTNSKLPGYSLKTVGELELAGDLQRFPGHGSPSADRRVGDVPYIKVSDLRAGGVNINPTNMIPLPLAEEYWGEAGSGLMPYDLISPARTSKNIGDFCVLMPGQERIVLTKEVFIFRAATPLLVDQFYLLWALTLEPVRAQWRRLVLMQTNREDVGDRVVELLIPVPPSVDVGREVSEAFRTYFTSIVKAREGLSQKLKIAALPHRFTLSDLGSREQDDYGDDEEPA